MDNAQDQQYCKGYIAGYRDGIRDANSRNTVKLDENDVDTLPVRAMGLSTRACNCLSRAGCTYVADVAKLNEHTIATMRNLGVKTAAEIAVWLDAHKIHGTAWCHYL